MMEFRPKLMIGDAATRLEEDRGDGFPWRLALLCLLRLSLSVWLLGKPCDQMVIRSDGSTSTKRPFRSSRARYNYEDINVMRPVVMIDMYIDRLSYLVSTSTSLLLLLAIVLYLSRKPEEQKDRFTDGDQTGGKGFLPTVNALLTIFAMTLAAIDLMEKIPAAFVHAQLLWGKVGAREALSYLSTFATIQAFELYLLMGGVAFQHRLFGDEEKIEDS